MSETQSETINELESNQDMVAGTLMPDGTIAVRTENKYLYSARSNRI